MKARNGAGAKGSGQVVVRSKQLATGGRRCVRQTSRSVSIRSKCTKLTKRSNPMRGAAGVDGQTIEQFEADLRNNLYKIWNRMSSGSYFPPPVRAVSIPKKTGGQRILGVPTVADRVAQMVVKQLIEPDLDPMFLADSYGYRPRKSALDAVGVTRQRCWKVRLGSRVRHQGSVRQYRPRTFAAGCPEACDVQMGAALHRKMADGAHGARGRKRRRAISAAPLKGAWSARFCRTSSCTTRSISG